MVIVSGLAAVGINGKQYIDHYRIDYAKDRLQNSDDAITTIALGCGFQSIRNFNRVFLSLVGVHPPGISAGRMTGFLVLVRRGKLVQKKRKIGHLESA